MHAQFCLDWSFWLDAMLLMTVTLTKIHSQQHTFEPTEDHIHFLCIQICNRWHKLAQHLLLIVFAIYSEREHFVFNAQRNALFFSESFFFPLFDFLGFLFITADPYSSLSISNPDYSWHPSRLVQRWHSPLQRPRVCGPSANSPMPRHTRG